MRKRYPNARFQSPMYYSDQLESKYICNEDVCESHYLRTKGYISNDLNYEYDSTRAYDNYCQE